MDSALAPIVAHESARPYFVYSTFLPVNRAYGRMFNQKSVSETLVPSPLLKEGSPYVLIYFQFEPTGHLTSPLVPAGNRYALAVPSHLSRQAYTEAQAQLVRVRRLVNRQRLLALLPQSTPSSGEIVVATASPSDYDNDGRVSQQRRFNNIFPAQGGRDELNQRMQAVQNSAAIAQSQQPAPFFESAGLTDVSGVLMTPLWVGEDLLLARRVVAGGQEYVQGCLLDWPAIKAWLLDAVHELLPAAAWSQCRAKARRPRRGDWLRFPFGLCPVRCQSNSTLSRRRFV